MLQETETVNEDRVQQRMDKASACAEAFATLIGCTNVEIPQEGILAGDMQDHIIARVISE